MRRIIVIGELGLDITYQGDRPVSSRPGGRLLNAAALLGDRGLPVEMVGDMGNDPIGDIVLDFLQAHNVGTASVDRYTDGQTPVTFYFGDRAVRYSTNPADGLDVVWPRIEPGDIVLFGGFYAIDPRVRYRLTQLLNSFTERKCVLVYLPGFLTSLAPRITRVMPALLENMEMSSIILTRQNDLEVIYGKDGLDAERCYFNHIFYYAPAMINVNPDEGLVTFFNGREKTEERITPGDTSLDWMAHFVADVAQKIYEGKITINQ